MYVGTSDGRLLLLSLHTHVVEGGAAGRERRIMGVDEEAAVSLGVGSAAVEDRFHVKHLHATILHQMGLNPDRLSYFYNGLDQKLVGVEGAEPIHQII